ncbi:hypothetical protein DPMN_029574 [Dreissena polymorpha]|uniref:Uncharacterized protein n=1 Tax=Dreissena polymorpha TaxID=45954 RepID=A0A9D4RHI5_DREPO|nr:hypothetical protein DPMN_029574 [Dreissena polymorpha]
MYTELPEYCIQGDWLTWLLPKEVGVRGISARSVCRLSAVGFTGSNRRRTIWKMSKESERSPSRL